MRIRPFVETDREKLKAIIAIAFDGVSIDQNIEKRYGPIAGKDWRQRKQQAIEDDLNACPAGTFVAEEGGEPVGFVTCELSPSTSVGHVRNFAVLPGHQKKGIGRKLLDAAFAYLKDAGMAFVRIETLEQNATCRRFYPAIGFQEMARNIHYVRPL